MEVPGHDLSGWTPREVWMPAKAYAVLCLLGFYARLNRNM